MAEKYFDDMNNDVQITGKRHTQKSSEGYNRLPQIFSKEDVLKSFGYNNTQAVKKKLQRLISGHYIERIEEGTQKGNYKKLISNFIWTTGDKGTGGQGVKWTQKVGHNLKVQDEERI